MFHVDVTAEDNRMIAVEHQPFNAGMPTFDVTLLDQMTGNVHKMQDVAVCDVERLAAAMICCHEPKFEDYPRLEEILIGCPKECRPIP